MPKRTWTDEKLRRLAQLRDEQKLKWDVIGEIFGLPKTNCCSRYHVYKSALRVNAAREQFAHTHAAPSQLPPAPNPVRDFDQDLRSRIARQGITAGVFGDPPPGRSALDQRSGA